MERNLTLRLGAAAVLIPAVLLILFKVPAEFVRYFFVFIFGWLMLEWSGLSKLGGLLGKSISLLLFLVAAFWSSQFSVEYPFIIFGGFYLFVAFVFFNYSSNIVPFDSIRAKLTTWTIGFICLFIACNALIYITKMPEIGDLWRYWLLTVFLLIWSADSFAYFAGKRWGKHKFAVAISPKKTLEGVLGGLLGTLVVGVLLYYTIINVIICEDYCDLTLVQWLVIVTLITGLSVFGDLFESLFKRRANIKDSGRIIPGHGGLFDRLDSFIMTLPLIAIIIDLIHII